MLILREICHGCQLVHGGNAIATRCITPLPAAGVVMSSTVSPDEFVCVRVFRSAECACVHAHPDYRGHGHGLIMRFYDNNDDMCDGNLFWLHTDASANRAVAYLSAMRWPPPWETSKGVFGLDSVRRLLFFFDSSSLFRSAAGVLRLLGSSTSKRLMWPPP